MTISIHKETKIAAVAALAVSFLTQSVNALLAQESQTGTRPAVEHPMPAQSQMQGPIRQHEGPQMHDHDQNGHDQMSGMMQGCQERMSAMHGHGPMQAMGDHCAGDTVEMRGQGQRMAVEPNLSGQDAFGAIQEIVHILEADPRTDWSKVNLEAVRKHFIDMAEVTLSADAQVEPVDGGIAAAITGSGRTVEAIQRMVPAHAHVIERTHLNGWSAKTDLLDDGVVLTVTAKDQKEVQHIRGLVFIGIMVSGHHHRLHHLALARGEMVH
jgi:hypothetical protein